MTKTFGQEDISKVTPLQRVRKYLEDIQAVLKAKRIARFHFTVTPTLPLLAGDLRFFASSPALPLWYRNLSLFTSTINKTNFLLVLLCHTPSREDRTRIAPLFFALNLMKC